jgi:hypothetical protein
MIFQTEVTAEELKVLAHVVADPQAWLQKAYAHVGPKAIMEKIAKYKPEYEKAKAEQGANYKNRSERDAEVAALEKR